MTAALKSQLYRQFVESDGPLAAARKKIAKAEADEAAANKDLNAPGAGFEDMAAANAQIEIARGVKAKAVEEARARQLAIETNAGDEAGLILRRAKEGHGPDQAAARAELVAMLRKAGKGDTAGAVAASSPEAIKRGDAEYEEQEAFGRRAHSAGEHRRQAAARQKAEDDADKRRQAEVEKTPAYKEYIALSKRRGEMDEFGRHIGDPEFNEKSAAEVMRKANADIKKAPKPGKLAPMVDDAKVKAESERRQKEALSREIFNRAGGAFTPDQARDAGGEAQKAMQGMGRFGQTAVGTNQAILAAMQSQLQAMAAMQARIEQQAAGFGQVQSGFNQLHRRAHQRQPSALNSGGPQ